MSLVGQEEHEDKKHKQTLMPVDYQKEVGRVCCCF